MIMGRIVWIGVGLAAALAGWPAAHGDAAAANPAPLCWMTAADHAAAESPGSTPPHGEAGGHHEVPVWSFFLIQVLGFALLVVIGWKYAWPRIRTGLDARTKRFADAFDATERDEREVRRLVTEYRDKLDGFALEAQRRREEALRHGEDLRAQIESEARTQAAQTVEKARREVELMGDRARAEIYQIVLARAFAEAANRLSRRVDDRFQAALVDRFIGELGRMPPSL
jgi:F-type H+-transporting ATPase subunit b